MMLEDVSITFFYCIINIFGGQYAQQNRIFSIACGISKIKLSVFLGNKSYHREANTESEIPPHKSDSS